MIKVGVVCEGPRDLAILERFIMSLISSVKPAEQVRVDCLQPEVDATSGKFGDGGWGHVVGWCLKYSDRGLSTFLDTPPFAGQTSYDLVVVQIDGDALELAGFHTKQTFVIPPSSPAQRVGDVKSMLGEWLNPCQDYMDRILYAVPVFETEAWLLSALSAQTLAWETVKDAKEAFRAEFKAKAQSRYTYYAKQAELLTAKIATECSSFAIFRAEVLSWTSA